MDVRRIALVAGLLAVCSHNLFAAPFVPGRPQSLAQQIADSRAAVVARPAGDAAGWKIETILHDATGSIVAGRVIDPEPAPPEDAEQVLLISNADRALSVVPLSAKAATYLAGIPSVDASAAERLRFAAKHIEDRDPLIAADAYAELARLTFDEIQTHRKQLPADRLRTVVDAEETPADRLGLYGLLLGLCGTPDDADILRQRLAASEGLCQGADGLAAGYLLLAGEKGLVELESRILHGETTSPMKVAAILDALAFLRSELPERFAADRLRQCTCSVLNRADAAVLAVGHLAATRDWKALPQVVALLESDDPDETRRRAAQVTAVRYLLECQRDADAASNVRSIASRLLDRIAENDPDLFRRATLVSGGPPPRY